MNLAALIFFSFAIVNVNSELTCRDEITGKSVDWFTLFKLPRKATIEEDSVVNNPFIDLGTAYVYMSNENINWKLSNLSINDSTSMPAKTLQPLYNSNPNVGYLLYNDQADKVTFTNGHTKGVILFDNTSAIWIVHSIPHYPPKPSSSNYSINPSQCVYGQSMLCISLSMDKLQQIGQQLLFNYPQVYDSYIPDHLAHLDALSNIMKVINGDYVKISPWFNMNTIETVNGQQMLSFAKFTDFGDDLYSGLVAPHFKSNLSVETWNNGKGTFDSNCSTQYQVHNIEQVKFDSLGIRFSVHRDHSKWTVSDGLKAKVACVGDINRQLDQLKRGGGTVCFLNNEKVWKQYFNLVDQLEPCKINKSYKKNANKTLRKRRINSKKKKHSRKFQFENSKSIIIILD